MDKQIDNPDFDDWQAVNLPLTSGAETYKLVREIAVDFCNAMFDKKLKQDNCFHLIVAINEPSPSGKPYRWKCEKCGKKLKIASGTRKP